ncbi:MAG: ATP-binding cassette domain-containing protein [Pseudomonadales bacterium]|nr:ATP-binding cassette domain-containing protein [Pseudomonadales bacterium]MDP6471565.1 ATP-binding cassette domain-containing protein [Pseudomonadales bacterium]MDP6828828.1 ATP-binding cassette domain-containing protein [Pseudomonadales bacterium]MDP6970664.1 ATP-binding cassette domain-containing protein [Pseudomonadales bacterium]
MITAEGLKKTFGEVQAVKDVSFSAADGKVTALLGPNGAGKSTTLRILSTVLQPSEGRASVDGHDVLTAPLDVRRAIGVLPHNAGIYDRLTARENIRYYGELHQISKIELNRRMDELITVLEMEEFCDRRAAGFSQGQKIKVALARALIHHPKNVLLDEPTNGLDVMATRALREFIQHLKREGRCVLFSSHIMQEVANLCDDLVIIGHGEVMFEGTLDRLASRTQETDLEEAFIKVIGE